MPRDKKVIKNKYGYYQLENKPSDEEINYYYSEKYFQQNKGLYRKSYNPKEKQYINIQLQFIEFGIREILSDDISKKTFLDLGAGEGWVLKYFNSLGCEVRGIDISSFGIENNNPDMLAHFEEGDIYAFVEKMIENKIKFDIINLTNVIEHVLKPEKLLLNLKKIVNYKGVIIITFPNDFSPLHKFLLRERKIKEKFWIAAPDHISYFNKRSFELLVNKIGYKVKFFIADFPIDIFLLNNYSNYIGSKLKGNQAHLSRIEFVNLIFEEDPYQSFELFKKMGELSVGRNLTAFLTLNHKQ